jgi:hypothetical protein
MSKQRLFERILYPFNVLAILVTLSFLFFGVKNLMGSPQLPKPSTGAGEGGLPPVRLIQPVEKKVAVKGEISVQPDANPFTPDHKDWVIAKEDKKKKPEDSSLNLEVLGIVTIAGKSKALLRDLNEKGGKNFWLRPGDRFKGYKVAYISSQNIIFKGKEKNVRLALKSEKGKLYEGKGEIFVAPDIDLYIDRLKAEEGGEVAPEALAEEEATSEETPEEAQEDVQVTRKGKGLSGSFSSTGSSGGSGSSAKGSGTGKGQGSGTGRTTTHEEEMLFIKEIMKIFEQGSQQ